MKFPSYLAAASRAMFAAAMLAMTARYRPARFTAYTPQTEASKTFYLDRAKAKRERRAERWNRLVRAGAIAG